MCGLVGIINKNAYGMSQNQCNMFTNMLYCNAVRGNDSTGSFGVNKFGNLEWLKAAETPSQVLDTPEYKKFISNAFKNGQLLIGHNRKATQGTIIDANAHPFTQDHITLVHNGTIFDHKKLADTAVDSEAICHLIAEKGHKEALKEINGAFTLIWYDIIEKKLHCIRNDKRPLTILETHTGYFLSSEAALATWIIEREFYSKAIINTVECVPGTLYTWDITDCTKFTTETLPLYKAPTTHIIPWPNKTDYSKYNGFPGFDDYEDYNVEVKEVTSLPKKSDFPTVGDLYSKGEVISFRIFDYKEAKTTEWDGILEGEIDGTPEFIIKSLFKDEDWIEYAEEGLVEGTISSINYTKTPHIIWLNPKTLKPTFTVTSYNGIDVTGTYWKQLPHNCTTCNTKIDYLDVSECMIKSRGKQKTIICGDCLEKILLSHKKNNPKKHTQYVH